MSKRKTVNMVVTVSVPVDMSAADARKEVRTLINDQTNWAADPDDIKVRAIKSAPSVR